MQAVHWVLRMTYTNKSDRPRMIKPTSVPVPVAEHASFTFSVACLDAEAVTWLTQGGSHMAWKVYQSGNLWHLHALHVSRAEKSVQAFLASFIPLQIWVCGKINWTRPVFNATVRKAQRNKRTSFNGPVIVSEILWASVSAYIWAPCWFLKEGSHPYLSKLWS